MIVLDTNVLSALMRPAPDRSVVAWLDDQPRASIWISAITVLEARFGLQAFPAGKRRTQLAHAFDVVVREKIEERIAPFDATAAERAAELMATRQRAGRSGDLRDTMLAGIVLAHGATLATRNVRHFEDAGITVVNPWQ